MPAEWRGEFTRRCLKAGAAGWLKPRFNNVRCSPGTITRARAVSDRIVIEADTGARTFDHVVLGTGYRIDLRRLGILSPQLLERIASADGSPLLHANFESSVPNLHFVGSYAVKSYGPLMRFIAGAPFAARSLTKAARTGAPRRTAAPTPQATAPLFDGVAADLGPPR
jgi:FAD-dependent urate hydroxylase